MIVSPFWQATIQTHFTNGLNKLKDLIDGSREISHWLAMIKKKPTSRRPEENDGGVWSLMGYIYQLLGSAARSAELSLSQRPGENGNTDALIRFEIEECGQDAVSTSSAAIELIQFKHSVSRREILPKELAKILKNLKNSERLLCGSGKEISWSLVTNRPLSMEASALYNHKPSSSISRSTSEIKRTINGLGDRLKIEEYSVSDFRSKIEERARCFGVHDISRIFNRVIGFLILKCCTNFLSILDKPYLIRL